MKKTGIANSKTWGTRCKHSLSISVTAFATAFLLSATMSSAQAVTVYKFVRDGIVTYSQLPPQDVAEVEVIVLLDDGRRTDTGEMAGRTSSDAEETEPMTEEQQRLAQLEAQMEDQQAKELAEQCQRRRADLTNLNSGGRVYEIDENGQRVFLEDRQIDQKREQLQSAITQYCS